MPKITNEDKINVEEKLKYLGLDFEQLPTFLKEFTGLDYRPSKMIDEKEYLVYKYIDIKEIEILLTPANRMSDLNEKYNKSKPIAEYLNFDDSEEGFERFALFLNMLKQTEIQDIEKVEEKQEKFQNEIPYRIRYEKNYLWQIYYSNLSNKYFMLVSTEDKQFGNLFYIIKKKIECENFKIYVPVIGMEHDGSILKRSQRKDIENYLWLFTKDWPSIYELTNIENKKTIEIVGQTNLEEELKTYYKVTLDNNENAEKFYKLIKALFILQTELAEYFVFKPVINENGVLEFYFKDIKIGYENLSSFIKKNYIEIATNRLDRQKKIEELEVKLNILKKESQNKDKEYLNKQKEIATYLECKKTFFR